MRVIRERYVLSQDVMRRPGFYYPRLGRKNTLRVLIFDQTKILIFMDALLVGNWYDMNDGSVSQTACMLIP